MEEVPDSDIMSYASQGVGAAENSKMTERSGNVPENKGSGSGSRERSGDVIENESTYPQDGGILLKTKSVSSRLALGDRC
jgi:hypothetical protein